MKKEQRAGYLGLTRFESPGGYIPLCAFCQFAYWGGCKELQCECNHPLERICAELAQDVQWGGGVDCWGFRPLIALDVAADMLGIWLQGKAVDLNTVPMLGGKRWLQRYFLP